MHILKFFFMGLMLLTLTNCMENTPNLHDFCLTQVCSYSEPQTRYVEFPFVIRNESLPKFCGYPGFDLLCNQEARLLINLPNYGVFNVQEIDYVNQELWLNDLDNCLPRRLLSLNDSIFMGNKSPFAFVYDQVYWFYNCSNEFFNSSNHKIRPIACLSGPNYGVISTTSENIDEVNTSLCVKIGPIKIPIRKRSKDMNYSWELKDDIMVTWDKPYECRECYRVNGSCGFKSNSSLEVGCYDLPRQGLSRQAMFAIALAFAMPLLLLTLCILYFTIKAIYHRRRAINARLTSNVILITSVVTPTPETIIHHNNGLDQTTIESYPKIILGESRRLPKPEDNNCAICLGEYLAKEILRTIPNCGHCFHADCIDEWLVLNASCPVCRNSPTITPENNASS